MSEIAKLTAAPRADVLPGYELSQFTFSMYGMVEEELERRHIRNAALGAADAPAEVRETVLKLALEDVREGRLCFGHSAFDAHVKAQSTLPMILWICLRRKHPGLIQADAEKLVTPDNERAVYWAVLECMGYRRADPGKKKAGETTDTPPDNGPSISPSSPNTESDPTKSPT